MQNEIIDALKKEGFKAVFDGRYWLIQAPDDGMMLTVPHSDETSAWDTVIKFFNQLRKLSEILPEALEVYATE